ncbi:MAG TPA: hypothetical protein VFQ42_17025 [Mycobacterium sp.]|nr:hypothetical protein [Mycobacterium sp.]
MAIAERPRASTPGCWPLNRTPPTERQRELHLEATRQARQSPLFFDLALSQSYERWTARCVTRK